MDVAGSCTLTAVYMFLTGFTGMNDYLYLRPDNKCMEKRPDHDAIILVQEHLDAFTGLYVKYPGFPFLFRNAHPAVTFSQLFRNVETCPESIDIGQ